MLNQTNNEPREAFELLGEFHPLVEQLGQADGLVSLGAVSRSLRLPRVNSLPALRAFLKAYHAQIILSVELPAICRACYLASRSRVRELITLDHELARQPLLQVFATASQRIGRGQLERLRPLRDERVVQRYLQAVREGRAHAWHTLVYGLTLALYSLPVRQGLMSYASRTLRGFIQAAARPLQLKNGEGQELLRKLCVDLPQQLESLVAAEGGKTQVNGRRLDHGWCPIDPDS